MALCVASKPQRRCLLRARGDTEVSCPTLPRNGEVKPPNGVGKPYQGMQRHTYAPQRALERAAEALGRTLSRDARIGGPLVALWGLVIVFN